MNLPAAIAACTEARTKHTADSEASARGRERLAPAQAELQRLAAEDAEAIERHAGRLEQQTREGRSGPLPALVPSDKHVAAVITAQRTLAAAERMIGSLEAAEERSAAELATAEAAAREAALAVLFAEIRAEFADFRQLASDFAAVRERLFAAYIGVGRDALEARQWLELDTLLGVTSDVMDIGPPWADVPLGQLEQTGQRDRPREARARINRLVGSFAARLEELASGESITSREVRADAAA